MKYLLILYLCSINTGQCPSNTISGFQFSSHYDCVNAGYAIAQKTFRNLQELEEWDVNHINENKIVVKFECKQIGAKV
jgi:hypothetical protein|tara:strand:+ start:296 stop:529 length:234 start_codon:yes stop_codon:yes gene_type:complete